MRTLKRVGEGLVRFRRPSAAFKSAHPKTPGKREYRKPRRKDRHP